MAIKPTLNNFISQNTTYGNFYRLIHDNVAATTKTSATTTSGYIAAKRYPNPLTLPSSFGAGVTGCIPTMIEMSSNDPNAVLVAGLEVNLGSINMSTGTFTDGSAMPTRALVGSATTYQTASMINLIVATTAITATTPTMTFTYTNERGTGNQSTTLGLPTSPVINSAFLVDPLASTDTGIQDLTNLTKSAGSSGTMTVYGMIPLQVCSLQTSNNVMMTGLLANPLPSISLQPSDTIAVWAFGTLIASTNCDWMFSGVADS